MNFSPTGTVLPSTSACAVRTLSSCMVIQVLVCRGVSGLRSSSPPAAAVPALMAALASHRLITVTLFS